MDLYQGYEANFEKQQFLILRMQISDLQTSFVGC